MESQPQHADVYERLYDVRSYTGIYRKRFELEIHDLTDAIVHDLSDTMRPNLNHDVEGQIRRPSISPRLSTASLAEPEQSQRHSPERGPVPVSVPSPIRLEGDPNDPHTLLRAVFHYFCRFGRTGSKGAAETTMDNANFSKLCRECPGLLDAGFTRTDVDLIFVRAKKKGERRINYTRFLDALGMAALQKYPAMDLGKSVPMLLQNHIAKLHCVIEFTDGIQVQAVWSHRLERADSQPPSASPSPPRRMSTYQESPPKLSSSRAPPLVPSHAATLLHRRSSVPSPPASMQKDSPDLRRSMSLDDQSSPPPSGKRTPPRAPVDTATEDDDEEEEDLMFFAS